MVRRFMGPLAVLLAVTTSPLSAEAGAETSPQTVVVTATRVETPIDKVGSSISVVTREDLERAKVNDVSDALRLVPGVTVARNGGAGGVTAVYVRGAPPGFTRVMIDGVEVNDPGGIGTSFDFVHLNVTGIERIEVLRGPQSTLYGSDAMAGVINIITKKGAGEPSSYLSAEVGSYETWRLGAGLQGSTNRFHYAFDLSSHHTDGFSAFDEKDGFSERDGYENYTLSGRVGADLNEAISLDGVIRYTQADADYDTFDGTFAPTEEGRTETEQLFLRLAGRAVALDGVWEQTLGVSKTFHWRDFVDTPGVDDSVFDGEILAFDWQNNIYMESQTFTLGLDWQEDETDTSGNPEEDFTTVGYYLQDTISPVEPWNTTLGIRLDDHSEFGTEVTYRAVTLYEIASSDTTLKGSWGTGFKAPSLFQLFASGPLVDGNPDLDPQTSEGWDVGFEQRLLDDTLRFGATYFDIVYEDLIDFVFGTADSPGTYRNASEAESTGVEVFAAVQPAKDIELRVDYTYLDNDDKSDRDTFELRRPEHQVSATLGYRVTDKLDLTLYGVYVDERRDLGNVELENYTLVNIAAGYDVSDMLEGYVRVENLLDEDYQELSTFGTSGIGAYVGLKARF